MFRATCVAVIATLCGPGTSAFAETYKWVDTEGRVHYGDTPPQDTGNAHTRVERIDIPTTQAERDPRPPAADPQNGATREIHARKERAAAQEPENNGRFAGESRCLDARQRLAILEALHLPVYRTHDGTLRALWRSDPYQGERLYLNSGERVDQAAQTREAITKWCRDPDDQAAQSLARARWIASEHCAVARATLRAEQEPGARRSRGEIESARRLVEEQCTVPTSGKDVAESLPAPGAPRR